jgi:hypothetical protein
VSRDWREELVGGKPGVHFHEATSSLTCPLWTSVEPRRAPSQCPTSRGESHLGGLQPRLSLRPGQEQLPDGQQAQLVKPDHQPEQHRPSQGSSASVPRAQAASGSEAQPAQKRPCRAVQQRRAGRRGHGGALGERTARLWTEIGTPSERAHQQWKGEQRARAW